MALLTSIAYARTRVRQGKTGQRVRLGAVITATIGGGPFNLTRREGNYARTSQRLGTPYFAITPPWGTPPFEHDTAIPAPTCTDPRFAWNSQGNLILVCHNDGDVESRLSSDDGYTWSAASVLIASASRPDIFVSRTGILVALGYRARSHSPCARARRASS